MEHQSNLLMQIKSVLALERTFVEQSQQRGRHETSFRRDSRGFYSGRMHR
jgi:hypothetical protein